MVAITAPRFDIDTSVLRMDAMTRRNFEALKMLVSAAAICAYSSAEQYVSLANALEQTAFTAVLEAEALSRSGSAVKMTFYGKTTNNAANKTVRVKIGTTTLATLAVITGANGNWRAEVLLAYVSGSAQLAVVDSATPSGVVNAQTALALDPAAEQTVTVTVQSSVGTAADNTLVYAEVVFLYNPNTFA